MKSTLSTKKWPRRLMYSIRRRLSCQKENAALKETVKEHHEWEVQMLDLARKAPHRRLEGGE